MTAPAPSTRIRFMLFVIAAATGLLASPHPLRAALFAVLLGVAAPFHARLLERIEARALERVPVLCAGRMLRALAHACVTTLAVAWMDPARFLQGLLVAGASLGAQGVTIRRAYAGRGPMSLLVQSAFLVDGFLVAAIGTQSSSVQLLFVLVTGVGLAAFALDLARTARSDWRAILPRRGGIGLFIGTFNPMHTTHVQMVRRALEDRSLDRVYVHATVIPKLHADALANGALAIVARRAGMRVYEATARADPTVNYFPTGRCFYEHETRGLLARISLEDGGLDDRSEVISWPDCYARAGFRGVIEELRRRHPGVTICGIHGSDAGGIWNRAIYDAAGLDAYPVRRADSISATAIRGGATGMTSPRVTEILRYLSANSSQFSVAGRRYELEDGVVRELPMESTAESVATASSASAGAKRQPEPDPHPAKTTR
jgi:hypothetical protein